MIPVLYLIPIVAVSVLILIVAEFRHNHKLVYIVKPLSTLLVITMAMLSFWQPTHNWTFSVWIVIGLLFCLGGDVALMFQVNIKAFRIGLVLFLLGHVAYSTVFTLFGIFSIWDIAVVGVLLILGLGFFRLLSPNLGSMKIPVILYMVIISIMLNRAFAAFMNPSLAKTQGTLIVLGALLFYISDIILAANRFWKPWRYHRISLAFYYAGQLLLALSAHYFV
jgi:uncharacterized membrane protein YhhN